MSPVTCGPSTWRPENTFGMHKDISGDLWELKGRGRRQVASAIYFLSDLQRCCCKVEHRNPGCKEFSFLPLNL